MPESFSQRHGLAGPPLGTVYRDRVPTSFRIFLLDLAEKDSWLFTLERMQAGIVRISGLWPDGMSRSFCAAYLRDCEWFHVFDVIEEMFSQIEAAPLNDMNYLEGEIDTALLDHNIGWQLCDGKIIVRGNDAFEQTVKAANESLHSQSMPTAARHLRHAITALSSRPRPNAAGAVAHASSAMECVLREITGRSGLTLSQYMNRNAGLFHPALKKGLEGLYGFASDGGARHGKEGVEPTAEEAECVVAVSAAVCTLLTRKHAGDRA